MKYNLNFAKVKTDGTLEYGPIPLLVVTHHHEEWDEPVFDPETGEPVIDPETGEQKTEHMTRDWDTWRSELRPTPADYLRMGYLPVDYAWTPSEPAPEGKVWRRTGKFVEVAGTIRSVYEAVDIPPPPPKIYSTADAIEALMVREVYPQCREWIEQQGLRDMMLATKEFKGDDQNFKNILEGLQTLLSWTDEQVEEVLAEAEVG